jgi:hypothetical protein
MGKTGGKKQLDVKGFFGLQMRRKSDVFWQIERLLGIFSTGTQKRVVLWGFLDKPMVNGARFGRIFPLDSHPQIPTGSDKY